MTEQQAQQRSTACPVPSELEQYRLGQLTPTRVAELERHLETCDSCLARLESGDDLTDSLVDLLGGLPCAREDEPEFQHLYRKLLSQPPDAEEELTATASVDFESTRPHGLGPYPERLGVYRLQTCIGRGAHGAVFTARHEKLDRTVVIKILRSPPTGRDQAVERFLAEMRAIGQLDHKHIIRATDADEAQGFHFLVMEYIPGLDAGKLARLVSELTIADACEIARQAALALHFASQHHLVHRDIKPSNLLVTWNGVVKLLDLGLVANRRPDSGEAEGGSIPHGTADYMSPEQWTQYDAVDVRADLYSLGCTLYRLIAGRPPFFSQGHDLAVKRDAHLHSPPPSLRQARSDVPQRLAELIERLLAKDPADRIQSPVELAQALESWTEGCDLAKLVAGVGVRPPAVEVAADQRPIAARLLRLISRRRWIQQAALGIPVLATVLYLVRASRPKLPELRTGVWRALTPAATSPLLSISPAGQLIPHSEGSLGAVLSSDRLCLWELGAALRGRYRFRVRLRALDPDSAGGLFIRYRRGLDRGIVRSSLVAFEWEPAPSKITPGQRGENAGAADIAEIGDTADLADIPSPTTSPIPVGGAPAAGEMRFRWKQYEVFESDGKWTVDEQHWAESWVASVGTSDAFHEVTLISGVSGIPDVQWDRPEPLNGIWTVSPAGRLVSQTREERLPEVFNGSLGVYVARGKMEFERPELMYEK